MFLQVQVLPANRDALRFLWRFSKNSPIDIYKMNVHLFGKTDSPCCSNWALRKTALDNQQHSDKLHNGFTNQQNILSHKWFKNTTDFYHQL